MRTRTPAQIEASRQNGAKSKGPATEQGKARSSQNALKHGLSAHKIVVLENESEEEWESFKASFVAKFRPRDFVEEQLVLEMAVNRWRLQRSWAMQTAAIDMETARDKGYVPEEYEDWNDVEITTYSHNNRREQLDSLNQMETRLTRNFDRALRNLIQLRKQQAFLENEPEKYNPQKETTDRNSSGMADRDIAAGPAAPTRQEAADFSSGPEEAVPDRAQPASSPRQRQRPKDEELLKTVLPSPHLTNGLWT
jgi:hypothetical protein